MITLHDLVLCDLMEEGHEIFFHFKSFYFEGTVSGLGCIYNTRANGNTIFHDRMAFENVSEWADALIQNVAKEYVTRFSSFKRICHKQSGLSLHTLRQLYNHFTYGKLPLTNQTIITLRECLTSTLTHIKKLENVIQEQRQYIEGQTSCIPTQHIIKPTCIQKIEYMHNRYLKNNFSSKSGSLEQGKAAKKFSPAILQNE